MEPLTNFSGRVFGYVRVSTDDQNMDLQFDAMARAGVPEDMIFSEHRSGKNMERPQWKKLLRALRQGDCVVVWKLDRLGRNMIGVLTAIEAFKEKQIHFRVLQDSIDTTTPMGSFIMHISAAFAQLERDMIAERTKAGVKSAKARGVKFGRQHYILSYPSRLKRYHELATTGDIFKDAEGVPQRLTLRSMTSLQIITEMNKLGPRSKQYKTDQSYKNWASGGYDGAKEAFEAAGLAPVALPKPKKRKAK